MMSYVLSAHVRTRPLFIEDGFPFFIYLKSSACLHDYNSFILCSLGLKLAMKVTDTCINATMQKNGVRRAIRIFACFAIFSIRIFCVLTPFHIPQHILSGASALGSNNRATLARFSFI